jgi:hypothetical protein
MTKALPTGYIDLDDAVEMIVRHKYPGSRGIILRAEAEDGWRALCALVLDKRVHARGQTPDGKTFEAGRDQFIDLQDSYARLATLRYAPVVDPTGFVFPRIEGPPSYKLLDAHGNLYRHARLAFIESDIKTALEPKGADAAAASHSKAPDDVEPPGVNERKRAAVVGTIASLGLKTLGVMKQKEREEKIVNVVAKEHGLQVSDRYVSKLFSSFRNKF